jgi:hypothetical protein
MLAMTHRLKQQTFNSGQSVYPAYSQGPDAGLILVKAGSIRICRVDGQNASLPEQVYGPDSLISRNDFLDPHYSLSACGDSDLVVKMIDCNELDAWLKTIPEAQAKLFELRLRDQQPVQILSTMGRVLS